MVSAASTAGNGITVVLNLVRRTEAEAGRAEVTGKKTTMTLLPRTRLSAYEPLAPLRAGGRAWDRGSIGARLRRCLAQSRAMEQPR